MTGPNLAAMAWRNLWRNRRRTAITLSSLAFGILLATLFTGMGDWRWTEVINFAARMGNGHVTVQHRELRDKPSLKRTVTGVAEKAERIRGVGDVERVAVRISGQAMLSTATQNSGVMFVALDPTTESDETLAFAGAVGRGEMLTGPSGNGIVLGKLLAENLETDLGKKVVYTLTDKRGEIATGLARVKGIIETGSPTMDLGIAVLPIDTMREVLGYAADEATQIAVFLNDQRNSDAVAAELNRVVNGAAAALTWRETQPELSTFIAMKVWGLVVFEVLILILIGAGIFNTLFVSVMERLREFGILIAIGFSPGRLFRLVIWESFWLGCVGILAGVLLTAVPYYFLSTEGIDLTAMIQAGKETDFQVAGVVMEPILKVGIFPESAVAITAIIMLATLLSGLYPAWRAGRVNPVETIKLV